MPVVPNKGVLVDEAILSKSSLKTELEEDYDVEKNDPTMMTTLKKPSILFLLKSKLFPLFTHRDYINTKCILP